MTEYRPTVLVLEDELNLLNLYGILLERNGHIPFLTDNTDGALEVLNEATIDLAVLDGSCPGSLDTQQLLDKLRKMNIQSVVVSGHNIDWDTGGGRWKADAFLRKPVEPGELLETLARFHATQPLKASPGSQHDKGT
ncbi:MAG: response regulator [Candidatus Woesearchaeota archaeon]